MIIVLIVGIIILLTGLFLFYRAGKLTNQTLQKTGKEISKYSEELYNLQNQCIIKNEQLEKIAEKINLTQAQIISLQQKEKQIQQQIQEKIQNKKQRIKKAEEDFLNNSNYALTNYELELEKAYQQKEHVFYNKMRQIQTQETDAKIQLNQIKVAIQAATAARLTEQEENGKWLFYSLDLSNQQLNDILVLNNLKSRLNDPSLIGKIIWSAFILKATNDLCNRVLGVNKKCGIYKITNRETKQVYIGQSLSIADRWKAHIKCGLGIDAPTTNKLYNKMQYYGIWMFTFELLEECPKEKLNEREKFWIDFYQSDKLGYNSQGGIKKVDK